MKSIILAAGMGKRLRPLTENMPKCLIDFNGRTFLEKQVEILEYLDIRDITIVTGYHAEKIKQATDHRLKYIYNSIFEHNGTLDSLALARNVFNDDVILINSDVLFSKFNLKKLISTSEDICLGIDTSTRQISAANVRIENGRIVNMGFLEPEYASGAYCGVAKFSKKAGRDVREILTNTREDKESYVFHLINHLLEKGKVIGHIECDKNSWCEIDTYEELRSNIGIINELLS